MDQPSIDQILADGRKREGRSQLVLGAILVGGGLAFWLGMEQLGVYTWLGKGSIGCGTVLLIDGLFRARH